MELLWHFERRSGNSYGFFLERLSALIQNCPIDISKYFATAAITSQLTFALPRSILPK
jgi:hypothetical protein